MKPRHLTFLPENHSTLPASLAGQIGNQYRSLISNLHIKKPSFLDFLQICFLRKCAALWVFSEFSEIKFLNCVLRASKRAIQGRITTCKTSFFFSSRNGFVILPNKIKDPLEFYCSIHRDYILESFYSFFALQKRPR